MMAIIHFFFLIKTVPTIPRYVLCEGQNNNLTYYRKKIILTGIVITQGQY